MQPITAKQAFEIYKPEPTLFVLSVDENNKASGMAAGWNMKCSFDPPLFAVSLQKAGYTHTLIRKTREFVVAIPGKELEDALLYFGTTHGNEVNKFEATGIATEKAKFLRTPLLKDAKINMECSLLKEVDAGDHIIFIGKILASYHNESKKVLLNMGRENGKRVFEEF